MINLLQLNKVGFLYAILLVLFCNLHSPWFGCYAVAHTLRCLKIALRRPETSVNRSSRCMSYVHYISSNLINRMHRTWKNNMFIECVYVRAYIIYGPNHLHAI